MYRTSVFLVVLTVALAAAAVFFLGVPALDEGEHTVATTTPQNATSSTAAGATTPKPGEETGKSVRIGGQTVKVDIADTPAKRQQGLSGRTGLGTDEGMLFVFPEDGIYGFWMKDMLFPIDILWLSSAGSIVHIVENASPGSYPASFSSENPARFVLELSAGASRRLDVGIGDIVALPR